MKISAKRKNKKILYTIAAAAIALLIIGVAVKYTYFNNQPTPHTVQPVNTIDYNPPTEEEKTQSEQQKDEIIKEQSAGAPTDANLNATITRTFQDPTGVNVRVVVTGTTNGDCMITLSKNGQTSVTKNYIVTLEATSAICKDALIPINEIPVAGTWDITVIIKKDGKQSTSATTSIEVTK